MAKSAMSTSTVKSGMAMGIFGIILSAWPYISNVAERHFPNHAADLQDLAGIISVIGPIVFGGGMYGVAAGRATATEQAYTPGWMAGANKEELETEERGKEVNRYLKRRAENPTARVGRTQESPMPSRSMTMLHEPPVL
jgi:hypothetical protein